MRNVMNDLVLNQGQKTVADDFFEFLFKPEKELIISGGGGVGKTFLMGYLIDKVLPQYHATCKLMNIPSIYNSVVMTATTNQAAEVLSQSTGRPASTIHSFLGLRVQEDFTTGKTKLLKTRNHKIQSNLILFIDEAPMIDRQLLEIIRASTLNCKIIYVGDSYQLAPVFEPLSPIYKQNLPYYELTQQMRNNNQQALMDVCIQLRETVRTGIFKPIKVVPGVIDYLNEQDVEILVDQIFIDPDHDSKILAYTNNQVINYNDYIRQLRGMTETYELGENLVSNSAVQLPDGMISIQQQLTVTHISPGTTNDHIDNNVKLEVANLYLQNKYGKTFTNVSCPVDRDHFLDLISYYGKQKDWEKYFHLKNTYPDLRASDAITIHKAQGSTFDSVFIDLTNLSTCRDPKQVARLLYVAFSRAKSKIYMFGELADKYGGLIS